MLLLAVITLGLLLLLSFMKRDWVHPSVLMLGIWAFIILLYMLQVFEIIDPTETVIQVIFVQIVSFVLGAALADVVERKRSRRGARKIHSPTHLRRTLFLVLCGISIAVMLVDQIDIIRDVLGGASFEDIMRQAEGKGTVEITGALQVFLYMFIVHPMTACVSPVCAVEVLGGSKGRLKYFLLNVVIVFLAVFHHGGRNAIIVMGLSYLIVYAYLRKQIHIPPKIKTALLVCCLSAVPAVLALSASRGIEEVWLSFYAYFVAPIPLAQQYISVITSLFPQAMGGFTFYGILYPVVSILGFFGIGAPQAYDIATDMNAYIEANYLSIGDYTATGMNTFMPAGAYPFMDGGFLFEFIFMFAYGYLSVLLYRMRGRDDSRSMAAYSMWGYGILLSFVRCYFALYSYFIGILLIFFLLYGRATNEAFGGEQ